MKNLNNFNLEDLKPDFQKEFLNLKNKIFKDLTSKKIKGKKFNGYSLANLIEEWVGAINQGAVPNINSTWDTIINKDIQEFYDKAFLNYQKNISSITEVMEQEVLIKNLYEYKLDAMMIFNKIFNFNQDTFNNSEYLSRYNENRWKLQEEISKTEAKIVDQNFNKSSVLCQDILKNAYNPIAEKLSYNYYSPKTCDEYIKEFGAFLNTYSKQAKGPQKVKILVDFLSQNKPEFLKSFVKKIEGENKSKVDNLIKELSELENSKIDAEEKNKLLDETAKSNSQKVKIFNFIIFILVR